jgi:hypothetical protein
MQNEQVYDSQDSGVNERFVDSTGSSHNVGASQFSYLTKQLEYEVDLQEILEMQNRGFCFDQLKTITSGSINSKLLS